MDETDDILSATHVSKSGNKSPGCKAGHSKLFKCLIVVVFMMASSFAARSSSQNKADERAERSIGVRPEFVDIC